MYAVTGLQYLPFNTATSCSLSQPGGWRRRAYAAETPSDPSYWLTGEIGAEATDASTTQLYDVHTRSWSTDLMRRLGIPARLFLPLRDPGSPAGVAAAGESSGRRTSGRGRLARHRLGRRRRAR